MAKTERSSARRERAGKQVEDAAATAALAEAASAGSGSPNAASSRPTPASGAEDETAAATPVKQPARAATTAEPAAPEAPPPARTPAPRRKPASAAAAVGASRAKERNARTASEAAAPCIPVNIGYLSEFVGFHLRLAQDASYRAFARIKEKDLVKPGRFPALAIIHLNPGISQSALGRAIARDKSTVSPLIKDLQKNGLISRKPSPHDRRSVTLVLTKKGERVLERLHERALEHEADLLRLVGASKTRLVAMLDKITGGLAGA